MIHFEHTNRRETLHAQLQRTFETNVCSIALELLAAEVLIGIVVRHQVEMRYGDVHRVDPGGEVQGDVNLLPTNDHRKGREK